MAITLSALQPEPSAGGYEVVEHTADWALRVHAPDLPRLYLVAALGMTSLLVAEPAALPVAESRHFRFHAPDAETLLVDWLGELAYLAEQAGLAFRDFALSGAGKTELAVTAHGGPAELQKHIKAVTYHGLQIVRRPNGLEATIVFDV